MTQLKARRFGATTVEDLGGEEWYIIVTPPFAAVCNRHGRPHLHRHPLRAHPDHRPAVPIAPGLTRSQALGRLRSACIASPAGLSFEELQEMRS